MYLQRFDIAETEINYTNIKLNYDINLIKEKLSNLNNLEIKPIILMSYLFLPKRYGVSQDNVHNMIPNGEKAYDVTIFHSPISIHKFFKNNYKFKKIKIS